MQIYTLSLIHIYHEGDCISLDGSTGNIYDGIIPTVDATIAGEFGRIMGWADKYRTMKVRKMCIRDRVGLE